jgi:hypothetical protein
MFTLLGQLVYRPAVPVVPSALQMTPTLVTLTRYVRSGMYDDVAGIGDCRVAYQINCLFLALMYLVFACNVGNFFIVGESEAGLQYLAAR